VDDAVGQVEVIPSELAQFARSHAKGDRQDEQGLEPDMAAVIVVVEPELCAARPAGRSREISADLGYGHAGMGVNTV